MLLGIVAPPVKFVTSLYYSTVSGENIGTSREVITELSNLIMTIIVGYGGLNPRSTTPDQTQAWTHDLPHLTRTRLQPTIYHTWQNKAWTHDLPHLTRTKLEPTIYHTWPDPGMNPRSTAPDQTKAWTHNLPHLTRTRLEPTIYHTWPDQGMNPRSTAPDQTKAWTHDLPHLTRTRLEPTIYHTWPDQGLNPRSTTPDQTRLEPTIYHTWFASMLTSGFNLYKNYIHILQTFHPTSRFP